MLARLPTYHHAVTTTSAAVREQRQQRRKRGMCAYFGCKVRSGKDYRCELHAAGHATVMKLARQKAKAA